MDNPITRAEHEEYRREVTLVAQRLEDEDNRQNQRIAVLENKVDQIGELTISVNKLATNMNNMYEEQKQQGERLKILESRDGEMWRKVVGYVITAVVGIVVGFVFNQLGM